VAAARERKRQQTSSQSKGGFSHDMDGDALAALGFV
jgi:hypothetical protein